MKHELRSGCPIAASLDVLGDRWTLVVLRDMLLGGSSRFSEFAVDEAIASNILTDRLHRLVEGGLIEKQADPDDGRKVIYRPLEPAIALLPVIAEVIAWGTRYTAVPSNSVFEPFANPETRAGAVAQLTASLSKSAR